MKNQLLLILLLFCFIAGKNQAQSRMARAAAAGKTMAKTAEKDVDGRNPVSEGTRKNTVPQQTQQASRIAGFPISLTAYSGYYREDFEGAFPPANWQIVDVLDPTYTWVKESLFPYSGMYDAYVNFSNVGIAAEDWIIMPQFTVAATDSLSFWFGLTDIGFPPDVTDILISTTDSNLTSFTITVDHLEEGINYPPTDLAYVYHSYSLAAYAGQNIYVAFKNNNTYGDGVHIDKVEIGTKGPDAGVVSVDVPDFAPIGTSSPMATVHNDWITVISFPVTMTITGGYSSTKNVTNLAPGDSVQVTFDPWTTSSPATVIVSVQTQLTGDNFVINDTLSKSIILMEAFTNYGWSVRAAMPAPAYFSAAAASNNNTSSELLHFGGYQNFSVTNTADGFLPVMNSWVPSSTVNSMPQGVVEASAAVVKDKIYVMGGSNGFGSSVATNQIYDPTSNTWASGPNLLSPVADYAVGVYNDSLIYYIGGNSGSTDYNTVQMFAPSGILWIYATPIPIAAQGWRGGIIGNKIVIAGGFRQSTFTSIDSTYIGTINPTTPYTISWAKGPNYPGGTACRMASGASLDAASGLVLFTGGDPTGFGAEALDYTFAFDVNTNQWKIGPPKPTPTSDLSNFVPVVDNDSLYMVALGGNNQNGVLDVNEWLNLGPFQMVIGVNENNPLNIGLSSLPNPFTDRTKIEFILDKSAKVKATIVDVLGHELEVLADKNMNTGNQQLIWDASTYADGIYICRIIIDGKSATQKLIKY